ncbi:MAG: Asp/Glu racemase [Actinomycetota bacterium]|nr:Asp/Glu racemase [Actinomycetota bacterium]
MVDNATVWDGWDEHAYGVIVPYDFALDREIWRWVPDSVSLLLTRTAFHPMSSSVEMAELISTDETLHASTANLLAAEPQVVVYLCASGSFVRGVVGEQAMREQMLAAGAPRAVTTSSALLEALEFLGIDRIAVATPYVPSLTLRLHMFLEEAGISVLSGRELGLGEKIWRVTGPTVHDLAVAADHPDAQALFISCTNLATYDVIAPLEAALGKPVITANQVSMWAALRAAGRPIEPNGQLLFDSTASYTPQELPAAG